MYTFRSRVRYSELDKSGNLSLTGVLNYLQDCSTFQSEDLNMGISYLKSNSRAWWLSSWQIMVERYPILGEEIEVVTWPYAFRGIYGYRNFFICDKQGEFLVKADSTWFFYDTKKKRPVRPEKEDIEGYDVGKHGTLDLGSLPNGRKISIQQCLTKGEPMVISPHQIDTNHHVNNAQYVEMAKSLLPDDFFIQWLKVTYQKAAVVGDVMYPFIERKDQEYIIALCDKEKEAYAVVWFSSTR